MRIWIPLLSCLAAFAGQETPDLKPAEPPTPPRSRETWARDLRALEAAKSVADVHDILKRIRGDVPHRPAHLDSRGDEDVFALDAELELVVRWKGGTAAEGVAALEIVAFSDLRERIDATLYPALRAIHAAPAPPRSHDPVPLIRAVNALHALGEEEARRALRAYVLLARDLPDAARYRLDELRVLPVAQLLFDGLPPLRIGAPDVETSSPAAWPNFPYALENDVPFMLVFDVEPPRRPPDALEQLAAGGTMRKAPLAPGLSPVEAADALLRSERWKTLGPAAAGGAGGWPARIENFARHQALGGTRHLFTPRWERLRGDCCEPLTAEAWQRIVEQARRLRIRWDPARRDFVR